MSDISWFGWGGGVSFWKQESKSRLKAGFSIYVDGVADRLRCLSASSTRPCPHQILGYKLEGGARKV